MASGNCALVTRNEEISCPWRILTNSFILGYIMGSPTTQQTINLSDKLNKALTAGQQVICMHFFSLCMSDLCLPTRESAQCLIFIPSSNLSGLTPGTPENRDKLRCFCRNFNKTKQIQLKLFNLKLRGDTGNLTNSQFDKTVTITTATHPTYL